MRIWYQSTVEIANYHSYREALRAHFARVAMPGTEVSLHGVPEGTWGGLANSDVMHVPYVYHRILSEALFRQVRRAEAEGYDAFILGSFTEPWLRELRSAVDIPVISLAEAAVHVACSVAHKIGLVTMNRENEWFQTVNMAARHLDRRICGIYVVKPEMTEREVDRIFVDPGSYLDRFVETARRAVAEQADAIIPSEGLVATVTATNGLREIDGATVVDAIGTAVAYAEMMARLHATTGLRPGRAWHYAKASETVLRFVDGETASIVR